MEKDSSVKNFQNEEFSHKETIAVKQSLVKKIVLIAIVSLVLVLGTIIAHNYQVQRSWVQFIRVEMGFVQASDSEVKELAKGFERNRKELGFSRKEYRDIMKAGTESGYFSD
ncbi:MAG: hypothetical protein PHY48_02385 [Candidatus Cloacimonetes bacterium]|nr:hypothetical protein [Candidatus Cloacimonadota bacterium]